MKLLSIIVPAYNMEAFLPQCVESILRTPSLAAVEVVVVNDGSKDRTLRVARQYADRYADTVRVIDKPNGNYGSTMELRMAACDTVIFLDYPLDVCLNGIKERFGKPRSDMPWIETEEDAEFIEFIKSYNEQQKPKVLELLEKYGDKNIIILESREQADAFLNGENL